MLDLIFKSGYKVRANFFYTLIKVNQVQISKIGQTAHGTRGRLSSLSSVQESGSAYVAQSEREMPFQRGKGKADWKDKGGGGGKGSRYQRQQGKGSGGGGGSGKRSYADGSQSARLSGGGRKESAAKAALRQEGDQLDKRFGYIPCVRCRQMAMRIFLKCGVQLCCCTVLYMKCSHHGTFAVA